MSKWALELQGFDVIRVWIRGEANILADAPSRAPWESALAMHLPIPDMPVRDLVAAMYKSPEQLTVWVQDRKEQMLGPSPEWRPIPVSAPRDQDVPAVLEDDPKVRGPAAAVGYETPRGWAV